MQAHRLNTKQKFLLAFQSRLKTFTRCPVWDPKLLTRTWEMRCQFLKHLMAQQITIIGRTGLKKDIIHKVSTNDWISPFPLCSQWASEQHSQSSPASPHSTLNSVAHLSTHIPLLSVSSLVCEESWNQWVEMRIVGNWDEVNPMSPTQSLVTEEITLQEL